jgi:peptidoglycan L-alanyl-D-glutamate endopeptidase CwlK
MQIEAMVRAVQAKLGVGVDGRAGPETWSAIYKRIVDRGSPADLALTETADRANARSERVIATLHARVQPYARALYFKAREHGLTINIISGLRSYAEQDALYAQGRNRRAGDESYQCARRVLEPQLRDCV